MKCLSPQQMHMTWFEDEAELFAFFNPVEGFALLSTGLYDFITVFDLSDASTFSVNAVDFGCFKSRKGLSSVGSRA